MNILITGATGQLGRALIHEIDDYNSKNKIRVAKCVCGKIKCRDHGLTQLVNPIDYILTGHTETEFEGHTVYGLDIADGNEVESFVFSYMPDIIINAAGYTKVDACETDYEKALAVNGYAPGYLAEAAEGVGAKLIHISTDYVLSGTATEPYTEAAVPDPVNAYGRTKAYGESEVIKYSSKYFIVRTAWMYGDGKNFVRTMLNLAKDETKHPIRVVKDQVGCPTSAAELARFILYIMNTDKYGIWNCVGEGAASWFEFTKEIFAQSGIDVSVEAISTEEYPLPAKRPKYSVLENKRIHEETDFVMKDWKDALAEYLA